MCVTLRSWDYDSWYSHVWTCQVTMNERWTHWLITSRMFLVNWFRRTETCRRPRASSSRARTVCFNSSSHCRACISRSSWVCLCISEPTTEQTSSRAMRGNKPRSRTTFDCGAASINLVQKSSWNFFSARSAAPFLASRFESFLHGSNSSLNANSSRASSFVNIAMIGTARQAGLSEQ